MWTPFLTCILWLICRHDCLLESVDFRRGCGWGANWCCTTLNVVGTLVSRCSHEFRNWHRQTPSWRHIRERWLCEVPFGQALSGSAVWAAWASPLCPPPMYLSTTWTNLSTTTLRITSTEDRAKILGSYERSLKAPSKKNFCCYGNPFLATINAKRSKN